ncbi:ABC transporter ATP-binding protein [Thalassomonas sp. M1454]|uniref:ABC transporter ATP-binding protein n=1 Tax=Thalassomonas sp. M1454 TaxID=2594477 RepID=UPI00117EBF1C|nr:ABC transporter ATP-binding protein [Thalassomonas sp. M1454]TRX56325.1 ABC transporter ATP-binding protein [Thalassomonas sp. M1454]
MAKTVLQTTKLTWQVTDKTIIDAIDFALYQGQTVAIVGPNGAGKTSLLKCLNGQSPNYSGEITLNARPLHTINNKEIAKQIAVVSQHNQSTFNLSVIDIVRMGLIPHKNLFDGDTQSDLEKIQQALNKVDLLNKQHQVFNTLSGGEQQRVLIAQAIVQAANILIMDEPTNHLDIYYQHQILNLVKSLNITLLITIHDLNLAAEYCDRIVLMDKGLVVADDTPEKVLTAENLKKVFNLDCAIDENPFTNKPRITFANNISSHQEICNET